MTKVTVPDLRELFPKYDFEVIQLWFEDDAGTDPDDEKYWVHIKAKMGQVALYDETTLLVYCNLDARLANKLSAISGSKLHAHSDEGYEYLIPLEHAKKAFRVIKPKLKDHLAKELRERLTKRA